MVFLRNLSCVLFFSLLFTGVSYAQINPQDSSIVVPLGGNAWRTDRDTTGGNIGSDGIVNWSNTRAVYMVNVRFGQPGKLKVYLNMAVPDGQSSIAVIVLGQNATSGKSAIINA